MKPLNHSFQLTGAQKWQIVWYGAAVVLGFFVLAAILGNTSMSLDALGLVYLLLFGLMTGISLRFGTKRGWQYHAMCHPPGTRCDLGGRVRLGMAWRAVVVWLGGRVLSVMLLNQADSDFSLELLLLVCIAVVVVAALYVGLRYGWRLADNKVSGAPQNTFSL